jgi:NTP pyrophosphatase (non-canonical NTP hydrolase)
MTMCAAGVAKLIEECGELQQVLGKRLAYWTTDEHPDGSNLRDRMQDEMGDVLAAIDFVIKHLNLDSWAVADRHARKLALFDTWQAQIDNNDQAIDAAARMIDRGDFG